MRQLGEMTFHPLNSRRTRVHQQHGVPLVAVILPMTNAAAATVVAAVDKYLEAAYVHREAFDGTYDDSFHGCSDAVRTARGGQELGEKIRACTESKGGHAAFASILWSAPASELTKDIGESSHKPADFYRALEKIPVDVLLLFGADDPWCTPAVAKRMHTTLVGRDGMDAPAAQRYIELGNVGHCPNHEAPTAVARVLLPWIAGTCSSLQSSTVDDDGQCRRKAPLVSGSDQIKEPWGVVGLREVSIEESQNLGMMDRIVSNMVG